ncbi:hypothetical protein ACWIUD_10505 [Helicobacter sp. 23-1044]
MTTSLYLLRLLNNHNTPQNKRSEIKNIEQKCRETKHRVAFYEVDIRDGGFMREPLGNSNGLY